MVSNIINVLSQQVIKNDGHGRVADDGFLQKNRYGTRILRENGDGTCECGTWDMRRLNSVKRSTPSGPKYLQQIFSFFFFVRPT